MNRKIFILFVLCLSICMIAGADERAGITIRYPETAEFELIQVASIDDGYKYTEDFENCGIDITEDNIGERQTANLINKYANDNEVEGIWAKSVDGIATFNSLDNGLYLVRSDNSVPFLVTLNGESVDATVKMSEPDPTVIPEPVEPTITPDPIEPTDKPEPAPTTKPDPTEKPDPVEPTSSPNPTETIEPTAKVEPTTPTEPTPTTELIPTEKAEPTKKPTETAEPTKKPTKTTEPTTTPKVTEKTTRTTNAISIESTENNKTNTEEIKLPETTTTSQTVTVQDGLPQTGQVWLPFMILFIVGIICIVLGVYITSRREKE